MIQKITSKAQSEILLVTEFLSLEYFSQNYSDLERICADEGIAIHCDDYGSSFDGTLVYDGSRFHIHLNIRNGNTRETYRGRFSLGHELGHYFIDSHRESLRQGIINPHTSNMSLIHSDRMEDEANFFASNLMLPKARLRKFTGGRKFSFKIIEEISS